MKRLVLLSFFPPLFVLLEGVRRKAAQIQRRIARNKATQREKEEEEKVGVGAGERTDDAMMMLPLVAFILGGKKGKGRRHRRQQ